MLFDAHRWDKQFRGILIRILEIEIRSDEAALHHEHRVYDLAGSGHPHLMPGLGLGAGHLNPPVAEHGIYRLSLIGIPYMGRGRMGIDISSLMKISGS